MPDGSTTTTSTQGASRSSRSKGSSDSRVKDHIKSLVSISTVSGSTRSRIRCVFSGCGGDTDDLKLDQHRDTFHCFKCKRRGDVFDWVMAFDHLDFPQALRKLAAMAGVSLHTPKERTAILAKAMSQYRDMLGSSARAKAWLLDRGLEESFWFRANIGYAAGMPEGVPLSELKDCGLVDEETLQPWFYDRVIFAVHNRHGEIVHLQGRTLVKDLEPKYIPTKRETSLGRFPLNDFLYGEEQLDRLQGDAFLLEGVPDTLTVRQYGLAAFGIFGNGGFASHGHKFSRAKRLFVILDNDPASREKALTELVKLQARMPWATVYDVILPKPDGQKKQDVNSWYLENGKPPEAAFLDMVASCSQPVIATAIAEWGPHLSHHETLIDLIHANPERSRWIRQLADVSGEPLVCLDYLARMRNDHVHS